MRLRLGLGVGLGLLEQRREPREAVALEERGRHLLGGRVGVRVRVRVRVS